MILASHSRQTLPAAGTHIAPTLDTPEGHGVLLTVFCHVTFYVLRISDCAVVHWRRFENDFVALAHHSGVSLCGTLFAVLSLRYQQLHLFQIRVRHAAPHTHCCCRWLHR